MNEQGKVKCAVKDCVNHEHEGLFVGLLCSPCHIFISGDGGLYSQAYRNSKAMIDTAVQMERAICFDAAMKSASKAVDVAISLEREACAMLVEKRQNNLGGYKEYEDNHDDGWQDACCEILTAIRARGEK